MDIGKPMGTKGNENFFIIVLFGKVKNMGENKGGRKGTFGVAKNRVNAIGPRGGGSVGNGGCD